MTEAPDPCSNLARIAATPPLAVRDREGLSVALSGLSRPRVAVMTMGALHAGHLDLVREAVRRGGSVIVTVFVNPLQFGLGEDLDAYPRTLSADLVALQGLGVDLVYAPDKSDMYPDGAPAVRVAPGPLGDVYEGAVRPGHFAGVLTVVAKLMARTGADVAVFGRKDAQQLALIRQMVRDLDMGVELVEVATRRDPDGLAMSSRNRYLSRDERARALALPRALAAGAAAAAAGSPAPTVRATASRVLASQPGVTADYVDVVDRQTFTPMGDAATGEALIIAAIRVGATRLIDNRPAEVFPGP